MPSMTWGLVVASGKEGKIAPDIDPSFLNLGSKPVLTYALAAFEQCPDIDAVATVVPKERVDGVRVMAQMFGFVKLKKIVAGTAQRATSILAALRALEEDDGEFICVHDALRPGVSPALIGEVVRAAKKHGAAIAAVRPAEAVKAVTRGTKVASTLDPETTWLAQWPQAFRKELLTKAYEAACRKKLALGDDSEAVSRLGEDVTIVPAERLLPRIASPADLSLGERFLG
jgi:2-C-methyl-D-erythritol 4-phosphate cytidylyltransferase